VSTSGQPIDCEIVESRLLDLSLGDLGREVERATREHLAGCISCKRSLARLEAGRALGRQLAIEEPPASVLETVRIAARAKAAETAATRSRSAATSSASLREIALGALRKRDSGRARAADRSPPESTWSQVLRWLGSFATGPQVAMATLLVMMIGIGLWSAPRLRHAEDRSTSGAVLEPDPDGEAGPSAGLTPAEPLRMGRDRSGRLVPVDPSGSVIDPRSNEPGEPIADGEWRARRPRTPADGTAPRVAGTTTPRAHGSDVAPSSVAATDERAAGERAAGEGAAIAAESEAALADLAHDLAPGESVGTGASAGVAEERPSGSQVAATEPPRAADGVASVEVPASRLDSADVEAPRVDTPRALASALHQRARDAARRGAHAECVTQYGALLEAHPTYGERGRALIELAECQRRLGRIDAAGRSLEQARRYPSVRADAERELARVRVEQRAAEHAPSVSSTE
jgi:hypothetical protein